MTYRKSIHISPYECRLTVIFTDGSLEKIANAIFKKYESKDRLVGECDGCTLSVDNFINYFIIFKCEESKIHISTFSHEIYHVKNFILKDRHIFYSPAKDEVGAYLTGKISHDIYEVMKKKQITFT